MLCCIWRPRGSHSASLAWKEVPDTCWAACSSCRSAPVAGVVTPPAPRSLLTTPTRIAILSPRFGHQLGSCTPRWNEPYQSAIRDWTKMDSCGAMQGPPSVAAAGTRVGMTKSQSWRRSDAHSHLSGLDTCSLYSTSARWTFQRFFEALLSYTAAICYIRRCTPCTPGRQLARGSSVRHNDR